VSSSIPVPEGPVAMVAGDFNQDGSSDLVVASASPGSLSFLASDGQGGFLTTVGVTSIRDTPPVALAMGDFDGQRGPGPALVRAGNSARVSVFEYAGPGPFRLEQELRLAAGAVPTSIVAGDFGDGNLGLAVADAAHDTIVVFPANGGSPNRGPFNTGFTTF